MMKRILSVLLVLAMLCSFGTVFAQEEAPAEETAAEEVVETAAEEPAEEIPAEEAAAETEAPAEENAEEPAAEGTAEETAEEPAEAASEEPVTDGSTSSGTCGDDLTWTYDYDTKVLTISGTGDMTDYTLSRGCSTAPFRTYSIETVAISEGVTSIGAYAFYGKSTMTNITIPITVKSIGDSAFGACELENVYYPGTLADWCGISSGDSPFSAYPSYTKLYLNGTLLTGDVVIPDGVASIGSCAFRDYTYLTSVAIPSSVTSIGSQAFYCCSNLTEVLIPSSVTSIGSYAFCSSGLTSVEIPKGVTGIDDSAFYGCSSLTNVTIPDSVTSIGDYVFESCSSLTAIDVSSENAYYTSEDGVLFNKAMTEILCCPAGKANASYTIPSGVTNIDEFAFETCSSLTSVTIPISVTSIGYKAFQGCDNLTDVYYEGSEADRENISIYSTGNSALTDAAWHYGTAAVYTISYNANGGSGAPAAQTKTTGQTVTLSSTIPTRSGYTFIGWAEDSTAYNADHKAGDSYSADRSVTLYAVWRVTATWTISYNANGGIGAPAAQTKTTGRTVTLSSTVPTRTGYTFTGWADDAAKVTYYPGGSFSDDADTVLRAMWQADDTVTAVTMSAGKTYTAKVTSAGTILYYDFTPTGTNTYVIYSTGSADTVVSLCDSDGNVLSSNDNGGSGSNFRLAYTLTAGVTYRYAVSYASGAAEGSISFTFGRVYTIRFNANGGSGAPSAQTKDYGAALTLSSTVPTRSGYVFLGWAASSTAESPSYAAGASYTANGNTTLYAVWIPTPAVLKSATVNTANITAAGGKAYYEFTPTGTNSYVIYSTGSADTGVTLYDASGKVLASNDNSGSGNNFLLAYAMTAGVTYRYAVSYADETAEGSISFTFGRVYTIKFNANGGSGAPAAQTKYYGTKLTLSSTVPTRSGYTFLGWSASSTAAGAAYKAGGSYTANGNTTLYAVWAKTGSSYTVTYDANGGSGAPAAQTGTAGAALTLSSTVPTRTGYTFLGWATSSTATAAEYQAGGSCTADSNVTLYAVWAPILTSGSSNTANITTGGQRACYTFTPTSSRTYVIFSTGSADTRVALYDASGTLLATNDNSGEGNNFRLAYAMTAGTTYRYAVYYRSSSDTGSISFTFGRVYTISYKANGGSGAPSSQTKDYGTAMTISSTVPTRSGYTFLGWSASSTAASATYAAGGSYTANGNVTLYAVWAPMLTSGSSNTANITAAGAKAYYTFTPTSSNTYVIYSTGSADTRVALYDASGTLLATNDNSGEGNNFRLAYAMTAGTTYRYAVYYRSSAETGSIPFTFGRVYTIRYSANGGSGAPAAQTRDFGSTLTISSTVPTREGYIFLGWSAGSTAAGAAYTAGGSYTANGNVTLYAVWEEIVSSGTCGDDLAWTLTSDGTLAISGTGAMGDYTNETEPWYSYKSSIQSVVIEEGVTSIGIDAFYGCSSLTSVTIPDSVTGIGSAAFGSCSSLANVAIPDSVTGIGGSAFSNCSSLTSMTIPDSVTSISDDMFWYCSSLTSVTIPDSVTTIGNYVFCGCSSLTSVTIPSSVTSIGSYTFYEAGALTAIYADSANQNYSSVGGVLFNKNKTELVRCPAGKSGAYTIPSGVTSISDNAFECCGLTSVTIPSSVQSIGNYAFRTCSSLTSVTIPSGVTSISYGMFNGCKSLTSVTIPTSVTSILFAAFDGTGLTDVYYAGNSSQWAKISIGTRNSLLYSAAMHYAVFR